VTAPNGSTPPHAPGVGRRPWLEHLLVACERVSHNVPDPGDPYLRHLLADVEELRSRLQTELDSLPAD
jgi:hypothetical protein